MVRRLISFLIAVLLLISICPAYAADEIKIYVNGNYLNSDVPPIIVDGRTLVPLRVIFEALGAKVNWNGDTQTVTAGKEGIALSLQIGSNVLFKNGTYITLDVPAQIVNDRTMVPVRAVAESFGADVSWDGNTRTVSVTLSQENNNSNNNNDTYQQDNADISDYQNNYLDDGYDPGYEYYDPDSLRE